MEEVTGAKFTVDGAKLKWKVQSQTNLSKI